MRLFLRHYSITVLVAPIITCNHLYLSSSMVFPLKHGKPVSSMRHTRGTTCSWQGRIARYPCTQSSRNHLQNKKGAQVKLWSITVCVNTVVVVGVRSVHHLYGSDFFPPISSSISSVSLRSGSNPRLPPGEDSKRKPKSRSQKHITERIMFSTLFIHTQHSVTYQYV